jgi:hypothetical protein
VYSVEYSDEYSHAQQKLHGDEMSAMIIHALSRYSTVQYSTDEYNVQYNDAYTTVCAVMVVVITPCPDE